jgi:hypothetical protein
MNDENSAGSGNQSGSGQQGGGSTPNPPKPAIWTTELREGDGGERKQG